MKTEKIISLFNNYLNAFKEYDLTKVIACFHLPSTLQTPDKVALLTDISVCQQEFNEVFTQLQHAKTRDIIARKASYSAITRGLALVCIDWDFIDDEGEVFADFCAVYHITLLENEWKIINVVSHELSNSINLTNTFVLNS